MQTKQKRIKIGRPRKYTLPVNAYEVAEKRYLMDKPLRRPRRKLRILNGQTHLACIACNELKPLQEFWFADAKQLYFESMCQDCKRRYVRERKRKAAR